MAEFWAEWGALAYVGAAMWAFFEGETFGDGDLLKGGFGWRVEHPHDVAHVGSLTNFVVARRETHPAFVLYVVTKHP